MKAQPHQTRDSYLEKWKMEWVQYNNLFHLQSVSWHLQIKLSSTKMACFFFSFLHFLLVNCLTNWGFPEEWHSTWKWEFGASVHYVVLARLQSSSAGVSLGPLRVLNNASCSLSRELISCKLSNQQWRASKELRERFDWRFLPHNKNGFLCWNEFELENWAKTVQPWILRSTKGSSYLKKNWTKLAGNDVLNWG